MHAPRAGDDAITIVHHRKIDSLFPHVARYFFRAAALHRDGDDIGMIIRDGCDGTLLGATDRAPGRPEVHQHGFFGVCRQLVGQTCQREPLQGGCRAADHVALLPLAYAGNEYHEQQHIAGIATPFCSTRSAFGFFRQILIFPLREGSRAQGTGAKVPESNKL